MGLLTQQFPEFYSGPVTGYALLGAGGPFLFNDSYPTADGTAWTQANAQNSVTPITFTAPSHDTDSAAAWALVGGSVLVDEIEISLSNTGGPSPVAAPIVKNWLGLFQYLGYGVPVPYKFLPLGGRTQFTIVFPSDRKADPTNPMEIQGPLIIPIGHALAVGQTAAVTGVSWGSGGSKATTLLTGNLVTVLLRGNTTGTSN